MRYFQLQKSAFHSLKRRWGLANVCLILCFFLYSPLMFISESVNLYSLIRYDMEIELPLWYTILDIVSSIILTSTLSLGQYFIFLSISRMQHVRLADLFVFLKSGRMILRAILGSIIPALYILLWSLLLIIPGIYKAFCYAMTPYILVDHPELSVRQAMQKSIHLMRGHKWHYFVLGLTFTGWIILSIFTLGIGFLWVIPLINATNAKFYLTIQDQQR
ncbi:DUF975 family protein [Shimazuella kribbensis]|uniref:DUF975 family protein n=1 Tax=Shimazuella kribbensis TaxID=139808 RepID=UPI0003FAF71F|nr:DUF975 family protein [Shimazuella kribbensis]